MKENSSFHHIGIACRDILATAKEYGHFGYKSSEIIWDDIQKVSICFLSGEGLPVIELISSNHEQSPVKKWLGKNGVSPYHLCFNVENIENSIEEFKKQGFVLLGEPVEAIAIANRKIAFIYSLQTGLIELVESETI